MQAAGGGRSDQCGPMFQGIQLIAENDRSRGDYCIQKVDYAVLHVKQGRLSDEPLLLDSFNFRDASFGVWHF
jgi:hypothetical protein